MTVRSPSDEFARVETYFNDPEGYKFIKFENNYSSVLQTDE